MTIDDRHSLLIAAGWVYDHRGDMYIPPLADAKRYNLDAAWHEHTRAQAETRTPKSIHDPRRSRPL